MSTPAQVVLVTGATSGIGAAIVHRFAGAGARIVAVGRRRERLDEIQRRYADRCLTVSLDITDANAVHDAIATLPAPFREVTVLVNSAGLALGGSALDASLSDWRRMIRTNVEGLVAVTHAVLPGMVERNFGDIVNIGSITGRRAYPGANVYGATKAFVHQFTQNLRADLLGRNIRAICIEPGTVRTEFAQVRTGSAAGAQQFYAHPNLMEAEDVAAIAYHVIALPRRVNVSAIEAVPISQCFGGIAFADSMSEFDKEEEQ